MNLSLTHRLPLLPCLPRRRRRQERPFVSPPQRRCRRRRPRSLQDAEAPGAARNHVGVELLLLFVVDVVLVAPPAEVVAGPLALPAAAAAEDPGGDGEGGGREGRGRAHVVQAVLEVVAAVLQARDAGAEAAVRQRQNELSESTTDEGSRRRNVTCRLQRARCSTL